MSETLASRLHTLRVEQLLEAAETIRDWPETKERLDQGIRYIREALALSTVGTISQAEKLRVFSILDFAMPAPDTYQMPPDCGLQ